jgi:hypothetical protein
MNVYEHFCFSSNKSRFAELYIHSIVKKYGQKFELMLQQRLDTLKNGVFVLELIITRKKPLIEISKAIDIMESCKTWHPIYF